MVRVMAISDTHCGHVVGLTPPPWKIEGTGEYYHDKFARFRRQTWRWFEGVVKKNRPIDRLIVNGDCIDGRGERTGGTELITPDRLEQADMFCRIVEVINPKEIAMTFGTPYHTGMHEDFEKEVAKRLGATIESRLERVIEGVRIEARHYLSSYNAPQSKFTALAREDVWRLIWSERTQKEPPHIILRSHLHSFGFCGDEYSLAIMTPGLQGLGSKFGSRICSKTVSIGLIVIDCENGEYSWKPEILPLKSQVSNWRNW